MRSNSDDSPAVSSPDDAAYGVLSDHLPTPLSAIHSGLPADTDPPVLHASATVSHGAQLSTEVSPRRLPDAQPRVLQDAGDCVRDAEHHLPDTDLSTDAVLPGDVGMSGHDQ